MLLLNLTTVLIIFITVFAMVKVLHIAYKRNEISIRKFQLYSSIIIIVGVSITTILIVLFNEIFDLLI